MAKNSDFNEVRERILAGLDISYEYQQMGLRIAGEPRASGKTEAYSMIRDERKPSAWIDINTGMYGDSGPGGEKGLSFLDFAIKYGGQPDFKSAVAHFAEKAGVELTKPKKKKSDDKWEDKLQFEDWSEGNDTLATLWCMRHKPGTSVEAIKAAGGQIAYYPCWIDRETKEKKRGRHKCIALPCYGEGLTSSEPVAWVIYDIAGQKLKVHRGKGVEPDFVKMKSVGPTRGAMMGKGSLEHLAGDREGIELVWKTAGPSDLLALLTAIPPEKRPSHIATCNASSETGDVLSHNAELFMGLDAAVLHDADDAGELGAPKWCLPLHSVAKSVKHVRLPYDVTPKNGKDFRDFVADGNNYDSLLTLYHASPQFQPVIDPGHENGDADDSTLIERQIVSMIQLDVLGEMDRGGVKVFSEFHRKADVIPDIGKMSYENLLRIAGPRVKQRVMLSSKDEKPGMVTLPEVKNAIALLGGYKRISDQTELGAGCWPGMTEIGEEYPSVVIVGSGEAAEWNGTMTLERIDHPRSKGHLLDFESSDKPWYDYANLKALIERCDKAFANETMHEAIRLFDQFRWKHPAGAVTATGLVMATWVQSLWEWRPQIAVIGPSNSGKTTLFNVLDKIFGNLALKSSSSSAAGIRQALKTSSRVLLCDEFEDSRYRVEILEMLRVSGRGDKILRGNTNQRGQSFGLRHMAWVAAIEVGLKRAPDRNRFIMLELDKLGEEQQKAFQPPTSAQLADLGQRLLAVAIRYVHEARPLAVALKEQRFHGVDDRVVESYSVPAAILAVLQNLDFPTAAELMDEMLQGVDREQGKIADEADLMHGILSAHIHTGRETLSVGQLIDVVLRKDTGADDAENHLAKCGIKIDFLNGTSNHHGVGHGERCLSIAYQSVAKHLLRNTPWEHQSIDQILCRIPGAVKTQRRVGGQKQRVILIGKQLLETEFLGHRGEEQPATSF